MGMHIQDILFDYQSDADQLSNQMIKADWDNHADNPLNLRRHECMWDEHIVLNKMKTGGIENVNWHISFYDHIDNITAKVGIQRIDKIPGAMSKSRRFHSWVSARQALAYEPHFAGRRKCQPSFFHIREGYCFQNHPATGQDGTNGFLSKCEQIWPTLLAITDRKYGAVAMILSVSPTTVQEDVYGNRAPAPVRKFLIMTMWDTKNDLQNATEYSQAELHLRQRGASMDVKSKLSFIDETFHKAGFSEVGLLWHPSGKHDKTTDESVFRGDFLKPLPQLSSFSVPGIARHARQGAQCLNPGRSCGGGGDCAVS